MVTGRTALLCALGALVLPFAPSPELAAGIVVAVVLLLAVVDWLFAGPVGRLRCERRGATQTRLGEAVTVTLLVANEGRRTVRARLRDAWVPSAGATPYE